MPSFFDPKTVAALFDGNPAAVAVLDHDLRYTYVNPALERLNGVPAASHVGRTFSQVLPGLHGQAGVLREVLADGKPREVTISGRTWAPTEAEQQLWRATYHRLDADGEGCGLMAIVVEITDIARQREELEQARAHVALLSTAAVRIGTTLGMDTTCRELADFVVPELADVAAVDIFPSEVGHSVRRPAPGVVRLRRAALRGDGDLDEQVQQFGHPGEYVDFAPDSAVTRCLTEHEPVVEDWEDHRGGRSAFTSDRIAASRALGLRQALVVPLTARSRPLGTLSLVRADGSPAFDDQDVAVASELAVRAGVAIDHARRYDREHSIARELQRSLLSEPWGPRPHVEVATRYRPADRGVLVGGDWYDVVPLQDGRHLKAMGDVMGHGVEAAVAMSQYRSLLRLLAQEDLPPHEILEQLDRMVERSGLDRAATCLLAVVDRFGGVCEVASAGHLPPVFIDPGAEGARIVPVPVGPPLGTGFGGYRTASVPCGPGTVLFMYTDGLVERRGEDIDVSVRRLASLTLPPGGGLEELLDRVLDRFGDDAEDDIAVLASRIREGAPVVRPTPAE
ncbi:MULTISPECIES: SpoIIE family protein phosphatase [Streptomyces]|uniref:SpoIIE family protein phosphatase n=1 Tax=Streptomyces TaxID=1883 RepID=UPI0015C4BA19|nr:MULTISPECIES: SpoIIE family protein phosphatase [Streptomyces]MCF3166597.1 SpoIIE family protein phosphatase [Streptomyces violaceoruber]QLG36362.1 SpoIIE family protein phosphatase [Streptomyces sp. CB04723]